MSQKPNFGIVAHTHTLAAFSASHPHAASRALHAGAFGAFLLPRLRRR